MSIISNRVSLIKPSATLAVTQKVNELVKQGKKIISLGAGEPDFDTPDNIKEAAIQGIRDGHTKYTNVGGMEQLKEAITVKLFRENNLEYKTEEIIVSTGAKQVIYNLFMATINEGDEVIVPAPYWVSYVDIPVLCGAKVIVADCLFEDNFKLKSNQLEQLITPKTKWLLLNSPNNPTGAAYSNDELAALAQVLRKYPHVYIMSDDIYEHIIFDDFKFYNIGQVAPDLKNRIFIVNGVSKCYSMTGWRIGYGAGNSAIIKAMTKLQSQSTSNPCSISQIASIEALNGPQDYLKINAVAFQEKRDAALKIITSGTGMQCYKPEGAFYLFPECKIFFGKKTPQGKTILGDNDFAEYLLESEGIAVVPGISFFGLQGYFRISFALGITDLENACNKIVRACEKLV